MAKRKIIFFLCEQLRSWNPMRDEKKKEFFGSESHPVTIFSSNKHDNGV